MAKPRVVANLVVASIVALTAGLLVLHLLRGRSDRVADQAPAPAEIKIVVAAVPLARGARLDADKLKLAPYFEQSIPEGAFRGLDEPRGRVVSLAIAANEPVTKGKLFPEGALGGIEASIAPGKRALSVKSAPGMGLGGLIVAGSHVDVYGVYGIVKDDKATREIPVSKLLLQNIPVLAVGEDSEKGAAKNAGGLFTLEVTPDEAEKLALAADKGQLHFSLRNPADDDVVVTQGKDLLRLLMSYLDFEPKPPEDRRPKAQTSPGGVVIIRGTRQELVDGSTSAKSGPGPAATQTAGSMDQGQSQTPASPESGPIPGPIPSPQRR